MKFSCDKTLLLDSINAAARAVSTHTTLPALDGILVETVKDGVKLTGYDLEIGIESTAAADVAEAGEIILNARIFGDIIRRMPEDTVYIESADGQMTNIRCGRAEFNIASMDAETFPDIPAVDEEKGFDMPQSLLKSMISQTLFAVATGDSRPVHTGSLFEIENKVLRVVSVDGYRLALRREEIDCPDMTFIVPGKTLSEVLRLLSDAEDEKVRLILAKKHIMFRINSTVVVSRLLEGDFLNYRSAVPSGQKISAVVDVKALCECVERASLIISDKIKSPIKIKAGDDKMELSCVSTMGRVDDAIDVDYSGEPIEIGFNNRYLTDALRATESEKVVMLMNTPITPCVIKPVEGEKFTFLVLPVRLK